MGLKDTTTGDTLCDQRHPVILESMTFRRRSSTWRSSRGRKRRPGAARTAIQRLAEEDPTFQVRTDEETGQTIISGMGELLKCCVDPDEAGLGRGETSAGRRSPTGDRPAQGEKVE